MTVPTGRLQFFTLEAGDYLERLALLAGRPTAPDPEELVRLARALRGSALMAGLSAYSQAASGLEQVAKAFREGQWPWTPVRSERIADAVEQLKGLARRAADWTDADSAAATALGAELVQALTGAAPPPPRSLRPAPDEVPASVRDFIAREGALVAGSLEHAAQAVELGSVEQATELVLRRLQPLRGLAALPLLAPLPDFLDAVELALRACRDQAPPPGAARSLRDLAAAVARLARDIAERGRADAAAAEPARAAAGLLATFGSEADVVDVRELFFDQDPNPIVRAGAPPGTGRPADAAIELVSLGDRLRHAADQLLAAPSETARQLLLFGLLADLRPVLRDAAIERPFLRRFLHELVRVATRGTAGHAPDEFARHLRDAAGVLARAAAARDAVFIGDDLAPVADALGRLAEAAAPGSGVVPIEQLAPAEPPVEPDGLERTYSTLFELEQAAAAAAPAAVPPAPAPALTTAPPLPAEPAPRPVPAGEEVGIVPVEALLYRGRRALERADLVRLELSRALGEQRPFDQLQPLVSELIDLVPLALAE